MIQQAVGSSINISNDSHTNVVENHLNQFNNYHNVMQVRRPNEDQILAFLDYEEISPEPRANQTVPETYKDHRSRASQRSKLEQSDLSPMIDERDETRKLRKEEKFVKIKEPIPDDQILNRHPVTEALLDNNSSRRKSNRFAHSPMTTIKSPKRKTRYLSKIFSKLTGKMQLVKKFVQKIQQLTPFNPAKSLQTKQLQLIQDFASDCVVSSKQQNLNTTTFNESSNMLNKNKIFSKAQLFSLKSIRKFRFTLLNLKKICNRLHFSTINPQARFLFVWELIKFVISAFTIYQLSIQLTFNQNVLEIFFIQSIQQQQMIYVMLLIYFFIDIIFGFKTGYYSNGEVIADQMMVAQRYLRKYFIYDAITMIPLIINVTYVGGTNRDSLGLKIINLLVFIKIISLSRVYNSLEGRLLSNPSFVTIYRFLSIVGMIAIYAHIFGCLWYLVGQANTNNWIENKGITDDPWYVLYSFSIYWAVMTMTTVGYGDISPQNYAEALFAVFTMIFASIVFAYSLNTIGMILSEMKMTERKINENMAIINSYMRRKDLDPKLQFRVRQYLQSQWKAEYMFRLQDERKIISKLTDRLQEDIQINLYGKFISSIPFFIRHLSQECLLQLTKNVQEFRVSPNTNITEQSSVEGFGLYQIVMGEAEYVVELQDRKQVLGKVKKNEVFGNTTFFYNKPHPYSVKATEECTFAYLSSSQFQIIIKQFPKDYEVYKMQMDQLAFEHTTFDIGIKCLGCGLKDHDVDSCPRLHFQLNKDFVIRKHLYTQDVKRKKMKRNNRRSTNARFGQRLFEDAVSIFLENHQSLLEDDASDSEKEKTEIDVMIEDYKANTATENRQPSSKIVRFRKRSHSMSSIGKQSDDQGSNFQKSMSGYKSNNEVAEVPSMDKISGITPKNLGPGSYLSQSSFNMFLRSNSNNRKVSKQQDSEKLSSHSNPRFVHKSSSKSSNENAIPVVDERSFNRHMIEDSVIGGSSVRQKKPTISTQMAGGMQSGVPIRQPRNQLTAIPSVSEQNETNNRQDSAYSKQYSGFSKRQNTNKSKFDTNKQFDGSPLAFEDQFEIPIKLGSYFPTQNKDQIVEKYKRFQSKRQTQKS